MVRSIKFFLIIFALSSSSLIKAQENEKTEYSKFPLKVALGNHAVGFPFQNVLSASNPFLSLGSELNLNKNIKHRLYFSPSLGFIRNKVIGNTIALDLKIGYRFMHRAGPYLEVDLGLGILDQFHPRVIYEQNETDGSYEEIKDRGTFASLISNNFGIGYDFSKNSKYPFRLSLNHNFFIQSPYFDVESFPIMPQSTSSITLTYKFKK